MILGFLGHEIADIKKARRLGFDGIELDVGALGNPVVAAFDPAVIEQTKLLAVEQDVQITALAYYGLAFDPPQSHEVEIVYERLFEAARKLGVHVIASMTGFDATRDWSGNLELFRQRFGRLADIAEEHGIRIALENWMGLWGQLPFSPVNLGGSPDTWAAFFEAVPSPALGLEFDPSHLHWQGIDAVRALREFGDRVYSFHAKDVEDLPERRYRYGVNGETFRFRIPGYGQLDWPGLASALVEAGYDGGVVIEHEDAVFGFSFGGERDERYDEGLVRGQRFLAPLFAPSAADMSGDSEC